MQEFQAGARRSRSSGAERWVLRHYRRGGSSLVFTRPRYLWLGEARARLRMAPPGGIAAPGLPVPRRSRRYVRGALTYRADLITSICRIPGRWRTRSPVRSYRARVGEAIGRTIARFHREGVHHADLNAHNILLDRAPRRFICSTSIAAASKHAAPGSRTCSLAADGRWRRSRGQRPNVAFGDEQWNWLLAAGWCLLVRVVCSRALKRRWIHRYCAGTRRTCASISSLKRRRIGCRIVRRKILEHRLDHHPVAARASKRSGK